jgi:hypothetical protein
VYPHRLPGTRGKHSQVMITSTNATGLPSGPSSISKGRPDLRRLYVRSTTTGETTHLFDTSSFGNAPLLHHVKVGGQKTTGGTMTGHLVSAIIASQPGISPNSAQYHPGGSPQITKTTVISSSLVATSAEAQGTCLGSAPT